MMKMFLLQLLAWIGICSSVQSFFVPTTGRLEADDPYLFYVGENITLRCFKKPSFTGNVTFYIGGELQDTKYITRVNNTYVRMERPVTSADYEQTECSCRDSGNLVNKLVIWTDYAPQNATHFQMVWLEKSRVITHWKHGLKNITYKNSHTDTVIRITSEWRRVRSDSEGNWHTCQNSTATSCTVPGIVNSADIISVRVNVTNVRRRETVTTVFPGRKVQDHAKSKPPKLKSIDDIKKKSIRITVSNDWPRLMRRVTYCAVEENECSTVDIPSSNQSGEIGYPQTMVVTGLHPSYTYTVRVQDKFENGGYFSDYSNPKNVIMLEDVPSAGPQVTAGSFYWDRTQCSETPPSATVYIFFQEVPNEQRNGQLTSYSAEVPSPGKVVNNAIPANGPKTLKVVNLNCQTGFQVSLYASTKEGRSPASVLLVPAWNKGLSNKVKSLDLRLRVDNGNVTAEWNPNPDLFGSTFYLYYCTRNIADPNQCQDSVKTVSLNAMKRNASVTDDAISMLGLAAMTPQGDTVGIVRSSCIYDPKKEGYEVSNVQAIPQDQRIVVTWQAKQCDNIERIRILQFEVEVCEPTQKQDCLRHIIDGDKNSWSTDKLKAGSGYRVRVRAYIEDTEWTGFSNPRFVDVLSQSAQGLTTGEIVGIASAVLIVCIILGSVIACYLGEKQNRLRHFFSENIEKSNFQHQVGAQDKPPLGGVDNFGAISDCDNNNLDDSGKGCPPLIKQQISDDSGCYPNSPPLSPTSDTPGPVTTEPGQSAQPSSCPNTPSLGDDLLDGTHPSHTSADRSSQGMNDADHPTQEEDSIIPPYVTATNVSAASNASVTGLDIEGSGKEGNEHTVCFVTHAAPNIFPLAFHSPATEGCVPFGVPGRMNMIKKEEDTSGIILDPSALEIAEKKSPSPVISSYVKLSTADAMGQEFPDDEMDNKSSFGEDDSDDDTAVEDSPKELFPTSALGSIQDFEEQRRAAGYHAPKDLAEEPYLMELQTKMNPAYVLLQGSHMDVVSADEEIQVPTGLPTDSQQPDQGTAGLHPGYVPHTVQSMQTQLTVSQEEEGDDKHISQQVEGESPSSPSDGYVRLPSFPRAASLPEDHHPRSFDASSSESEESDADNSDDFNHDYLSKDVGEGHPTNSKHTLDGNGYVRIDHSPDGSSLFTQGNGLVSSSIRSQTSTDGKSFAEKSCLEDRKTDEVRVNSNGYVAWQNLPFQKNQQSQC